MGKCLGFVRSRCKMGMAKAAELCLTKEEINYLEEPYVPHALVGVMAQNTAEQAKKKHVWSTGYQKL